MLLSLLSGYHRSGLRGSYRATMLLSRLIDLSSAEVPTPYGPVRADLRLSSGQALLNYSGSPEASEMKRWIRHGDVCYDVGAHLGLYSAMMAGCAGPTYAFEANSMLVPNLRATGEAVGFEVVHAALSDETGTAKFYVPEEASMGSLADWTHGKEGAGRVRESVCEMRRLDDLDLPAPDFVKIDVEGAEMKVVRGGLRKLTERRPVVYMEMMPSAFGYDPDEMFRLFHRYRFFLDGEEVERFDRPWGNVTFAPEERL